MTSILQHNCQNTGQLTEKTWGRGWVVFGSEYKMAEHFTRFAIATTLIIQLGGRHLLLGEYLQN